MEPHSCFPAALSIVMNMFPEGVERNKALGIWGGVGALGGTVGLLAGGILTTYVGWQYIFFFNVPICPAALILAPIVVPESRAGGAQRRYDPFGAVSITAALLVLVYAISEAPQVGWTGTQTVVLLWLGAALFVVFFIIETKVEAPALSVGPVAAAKRGRVERGRLPARGELFDLRLFWAPSTCSRCSASPLLPPGRPG